MSRSRSLVLSEEGRSRLADLERLQAGTNARGGEQLTKLNGTSGRWPDHKIIRTGSLDLDMCIGIGGIPRGRVCEIFGQESSGKTTLMLHVVAEAQRAGMNVIYVDAESALVPDWAESLGVNLDYWLVNQPDSLPGAIDLMAHAMKESLEGDANDLLIVLDSIPALAPQEVLDSSAEQQTRALAARYWSAQLPKLVGLARRSRSTILMINQMRESMDMYTPASTPGGKAIKFNASLRMQISRKMDSGERKSAGGISGQATEVNVIKNKVGSPFKTAAFFLHTKGATPGINWAEDVIDTAVGWDRYIEADTQYPDVTDPEESVSKKNWYAVRLRRGWLEKMRADELEAFLVPGEDGVVPDEADFEFSIAEETRVIQKYHWAPFKEMLLRYPSLLEEIEEALLNSLNRGQAVDDVEEAIEDVEERLLEGAES